MWILKFLPNWIFYVILLAGIIGMGVSKFVPAIYRPAVRYGGLAAFVIGLFMAGAIYDNEAWVARVKEMEAKVAAAEEQSKQENIKIVDRVVTKTEVIKTRGEDVVKYIDREVTKYDTTCVIPKEFIKAHNDAAEQPK